MRKKVFGRHLSRGRKSRVALFRSLIRALVLNGKIVTTKAKAKAIVPLAEKLVVLGKEGSVASRRRILAALGNDREITDILFSKVALAFTKRTGGFIILVKPPVLLVKARATFEKRMSVISLSLPRAANILLLEATEPSFPKTTSFSARGTIALALALVVTIFPFKTRALINDLNRATRDFLPRER